MAITTVEHGGNESQDRHDDSTVTAWSECFRFGQGGGKPSIRLAQRDVKSFDLETEIEYRQHRSVGSSGATGVGRRLDMGLDHLDLTPDEQAALRIVRPYELRGSDLASVPAVFRWWAQTYGRHTPAALIHDKFIGENFTSDPDDLGIWDLNGRPVLSLIHI